MKSRHVLLEQQIAHHNEAYFGYDNPEISDAEYDSLKHELRHLYTVDPGLKPEGSVLDSVGAPVQVILEAHKDRPKVKHDSPMLSLDNLHTPQDAEKFREKIYKALDTGNVPFHVEAKTDGLSVSLVYHKGRLVRAATRGDGATGEDVTDNARTLASIPQEISFRKPLEVRGEVYIDRADLDRMNADPAKRRDLCQPPQRRGRKPAPEGPGRDRPQAPEIPFPRPCRRTARENPHPGGDREIPRGTRLSAAACVPRKHREDLADRPEEPRGPAL